MRTGDGTRAPPGTPSKITFSEFGIPKGTGPLGRVQGEALRFREALIQTKTHIFRRINMQNIYRQKSPTLS